MKRSTKRYIFLFCWWLGLVVIWDAFFFTQLGQPMDVLWYNEWLGYFDPLLIVQSLFLWLALKKYFPGFKNWGWVVVMPFIADLGYWATIFTYSYMISLFGVD